MGSWFGRHKRNDNEEFSPTGELSLYLPQMSSWESLLLLIMKTLQNYYKATSSTTLYDFPLELMDVILVKSYLHWILNSSTRQKDEDVIRSLISVDVCFYRRITRRRFKNKVCRYLKYIYRKTKKRSAIIASNRQFLLDTILPTDKFISSLLSLNCLTEEQSRIVQRQSTIQDKNAKLLYVVNAFDETRFSNFVKSLRESSQKTVARILENGGGVMKLEVENRGERHPQAVTHSRLLHQRIEDLRNRTRPRSLEEDKLIIRLKKKGIEILNSHLNRRTVVVWIWCRSQAALQYVQRLYESNQLNGSFFKEIQPLTPWLISIDRNQFKKTVVVCSISINFTHRLPGNEDVYGVAKLWNETYVIYQTLVDAIHVIRVFEGRNTFRLLKEIKVREMQNPSDIRSCEIDNCLYVSDYDGKCIWKISRRTVTNYKYKITKWITTDYLPSTLSVSSGGHLMVINDPSSIPKGQSSKLMIYGSNAEMIRSIQFPREIVELQHAVETSIGNFIIVHECSVEEEVKKVDGTSGRKSVMKWVVSEMTSDGQMVVRRFIPSNETEELDDPTYLSLDSYDQVFVADKWNSRVIFFDSDLAWNRIVVPTEEEHEESQIYTPVKLCYDEPNKQLIVGGLSNVSVYTFVRN